MATTSADSVRSPGTRSAESPPAAPLGEAIRLEAAAWQTDRRSRGTFDWRAFLDRFVSPCVFCGMWGSGPLCIVCRHEPPLQSVTSRGLDVLSLGPYVEPLAGRIRALKYEAQTRWAGPLGRALADRIGRVHDFAPEEPRKLVPVPLFPTRLAERGYNQAALVARAAGTALGIPVDTAMLIRARDTPRQARSNRTERLRGVEGAFVARAARRKGAQLVLVDDVTTTGSTLDACAAALSVAGHRVVGAVTLAHAE